MIKASKLTLVVFVFAMVSTSFITPLHSKEENCGTVHKQRREPVESQRFWPLAEYGGRAFIDMRTCLVWRLDVEDEPGVTLSEAMGLCAELGQGGPYGEMGWQLPTAAELTSLDGKEWEEQRGTIPPLTRSDTEYWTSTPWLGSPGSWVVVQFSGRTTVVRPLEPGMRAAVWCVRGFPASGLE